MKKVKVTIAHLEEHYEGIVQGAKVTFKVIQDGKVLVEETLSGKATGPYVKMYEVNATDSNISIEHDRHDLPWLKITAVLL